MSSPFTHRGTLQQLVHDFDSDSPSRPTTFPTNYLGGYIAPSGPDGEEPGGDQAAPKWWWQADLSQIEFVEMYGDGTITRRYGLPLHIWAEAEMLEDVVQLAGAELETYFAAASATGWVFRTTQIEILPGVAEVGGFAGRTAEIPTEVS
ncbi:MAG: hypothetical protein O7A04_07595 [Acidobacteria bacterium]|nr:hypothetical protein [Acidobacteriota bacterium]